jgi:hypothetical protein
MTLQTHNRLMLWGFVLGYLAVMGSLVVVSAPILQSWKTVFLWILLLCAVIGCLAIAVGKLRRIDETF